MRSFNAMKPLSPLGFAVIVLLAACGPDGGQMGSGSRQTETGAGSDAGSTSPGSAILGVWQYVSGTVLFTCSDGTNQSVDANGGTVDFTRGASPARVVRVDDQHCSLGCSVAGDTITCDAGTCSSGGVVSTTKSDVFSITGAQLQETSTLQLDDGTGTTCNVALIDGVLGPAPPGQ
jgi:hypothetical protein